LVVRTNQSNQPTMSKLESNRYRTCECDCRGSSPHNWVRTGERYL